MNIFLDPAIQKEIDDRLTSGQYQTVEDVITAALFSLRQQEAFTDFAPGQLNALIEEGEKDIANGDVIDGETFFAEMRRMSAQRRGDSK